MLKTLQRYGISKGAKIANEVNRLYKEGEVKRAERLKKKLPLGDSYKMYWITSESINLRIREGK